MVEADFGRCRCRWIGIDTYQNAIVDRVPVAFARGNSPTVEKRQVAVPAAESAMTISMKPPAGTFRNPRLAAQLGRGENFRSGFQPSGVCLSPYISTRQASQFCDEGIRHVDFWPVMRASKTLADSANTSRQTGRIVIEIAQ